MVRSLSSQKSINKLSKNQLIILEFNFLIFLVVYMYLNIFYIFNIFNFEDLNILLISIRFDIIEKYYTLRK